MCGFYLSQEMAHDLHPEESNPIGSSNWLI